ncbi:hypothetical protein EVAR_60590_1 [Eumeta japonica]|uniref:Uncharacterized protein n=1 Tax=Eumeta variegata TaxID=151549 RepID=A0A4C1YHB8_EUMVA|nr:hypothetical protein EVAR_60590_1 [Eumeta japonica]
MHGVNSGLIQWRYERKCHKFEGQVSRRVIRFSSGYAQLLRSHQSLSASWERIEYLIEEGRVVGRGSERGQLQPLLGPGPAYVVSPRHVTGRHSFDRPRRRRPRRPVSNREESGGAAARPIKKLKFNLSAIVRRAAKTGAAAEKTVPPGTAAAGARALPAEIAACRAAARRRLGELKPHCYERRDVPDGLGALYGGTFENSRVTFESSRSESESSTFARVTCSSVGDVAARRVWSATPRRIAMTLAATSSTSNSNFTTSVVNDVFARNRTEDIARGDDAGRRPARSLHTII